MAAKKVNLNARTFLVLSGSSNPLGQMLAQEMCGRLATGSMALILDENRAQLELLEKLLKQQLKPNSVQIFTGLLNADHSNGAHLLEQSLQGRHRNDFERAIIVHNEGDAATHILMEPQTELAWTDYVQRHLYAPVALNQHFLNSEALTGIEKLVVNVTSSLQVRPLVYNTLLCSCKRARDMYFRSMASEEALADVHVLSYGPGLFDTHQTQCGINGNYLIPEELLMVSQDQIMLRVQPLQSTLKLINILEKIAFVSGHDVDYYDTFNL
ncbi:sepiapterin reductase-like [Drosophila grimshawi]|uniref:GH12504 n=1 Tax=Drosophila grimshawi TaxID=7222 RepID=B4JJK3_DROGR|nr:sepiapterin reductase [Drosophila grimshawi]XP_043070658.1 sepiapterin reductase-like [Drosophila grimshawi]EDV99755.1 GH12504 [Drosophila grimshawi]